MTGGLVWAIKNGDIEQVKELVDKQVQQRVVILFKKFHQILQPKNPPNLQPKNRPNLQLKNPLNLTSKNPLYFYYHKIF